MYYISLSNFFKTYVKAFCFEKEIQIEFKMAAMWSYDKTQFYLKLLYFTISNSIENKTRVCFCKILIKIQVIWRIKIYVSLLSIIIWDLLYINFGLYGWSNKYFIFDFGALKQNAVNNHWNKSLENN